MSSIKAWIIRDHHFESYLAPDKGDLTYITIEDIEKKYNFEIVI